MLLNQSTCVHHLESPCPNRSSVSCVTVPGELQSAMRMTPFVCHMQKAGPYEDW